ncbi:hypothetical protein KJ603_01000 [Patescibacteria group bacterium]|nr:hypothetical protein [Patescibacteria group bacterium]
MKIEFTKEQYEELMFLVSLGSWVKGGVVDIVGEDNSKVDDLENYLAEQAKENDLSYLIEDFEGRVILNETISKKVEELMEIYDEDVFWSELETCLGKRDFYRTITDKDKKEMEENQDWLPERIHEIYGKYQEEFEKNGIERLEIKK